MREECDCDLPQLTGAQCFVPVECDKVPVVTMVEPIEVGALPRRAAICGKCSGYLFCEACGGVPDRVHEEKAVCEVCVRKTFADSMMDAAFDDLFKEWDRKLRNKALRNKAFLEAAADEWVIDEGFSFKPRRYRNLEDKKKPWPPTFKRGGYDPNRR